MLISDKQERTSNTSYNYKRTSPNKKKEHNNDDLGAINVYSDQKSKRSNTKKSRKYSMLSKMT